MRSNPWLRPGSWVAALILLPCLSAAAAPDVPSPSGGASSVVAIQIRDEIEPIMAEYVDEGIDAANRDGAALILITIDTPGGLDTSMRDIIQHIVESNVPVAVYVSPRGARA